MHQVTESRGTRKRKKRERKERKKKEREGGKPPHNSCSTRAGPDAHARYSHGFLALWRPRTAIGPVLPLLLSPLSLFLFFPSAVLFSFQTRDFFFFLVCMRTTACVGTHMSRIPTVPSPPSPCGRAPAKRPRMRPVTRTPLPCNPSSTRRRRKGSEGRPRALTCTRFQPFCRAFSKQNREGARVSKQPPCSARLLKTKVSAFTFFLRLPNTCARWYVRTLDNTHDDGMSVRCDGI